jgi:putative nucleotidyltransferase with HDIG domain/PAS domain S-box-containing protein
MHMAASPTPESPFTELMHIALSLDALNCGALLVSRNGTVAHVNPALCRAMRRRREELIGVDLLRMYLPGEGREVVRSMLDQFDQSRELEFFLPLPDDQRLPVIVSSRPVGLNGVLSEYAVVTTIDISRQKKAEQQLIEQNTYISELSDRVIEQAKILREHALSLEERVKERTAELHTAHMETIYILAIASEAKDHDTGEHVRRVKRMSELLASRMGITPQEAERLGNSAILHDVGKIHTPDSVLKKPGPLTDLERDLIREHTIAGERILAPSPYFLQASRIARSHHENWDGTGYPDGLAGTAIPYEARLVHLVDVYDALTHPRVYKSAWTEHDAVAEIEHGRGTMFDPDAVDAFLRAENAGEFARIREAV